MKRLFFVFVFLVLISISACTNQGVDDDLTQEPTLVTLTPTVAPTEMLTLSETADIVVNALAEEDLTTVADFVHPELGLRFSPYAFVRDEHQVFMPEELPGMLDSEEVFTWGHYDGSGEPIELSFSEYYQAFVYSADFAEAEQMAVNERLGQGNSINNIEDYFPGSSFVEYHFSGFDPQYEGMDWESLRLVFLEEEGRWWLAAIVHDEWTI